MLNRLNYEAIARNFCEKIKKEYPNCYFSHTGHHDDEVGTVVIYGESRIESDPNSCMYRPYERCLPMWKVTWSGKIVQIREHGGSLLDARR
jgi:hypothetical protein